jgi:hypothetical protein
MEQRYQAVLEVQAGVPVVDLAQRLGVARRSADQCGGNLGAEGLPTPDSGLWSG